MLQHSRNQNVNLTAQSISNLCSIGS